MIARHTARAAVLVAALAGAFGEAAAPDGPCPAGYASRSPAQVLDDHRAALAKGDVELDILCNYAPDAVVISDQGVDSGRDAIRRSLLGLVAFFAKAVPTVKSEVVAPVSDGSTHVARVIFSVETPCVDVRDGVDTYIIRGGRIHAQTAHGSPIFKCTPPRS